MSMVLGKGGHEENTRYEAVYFARQGGYVGNFEADGGWAQLERGK